MTFDRKLGPRVFADELVAVIIAAGFATIRHDGWGRKARVCGRTKQLERNPFLFVDEELMEACPFSAQELEDQCPGLDSLVARG